MANGVRVIFADPIGHVLGAHDREICRQLTARGQEVVLATNERHPFSADGAGFAHITPFRGVVGDGNRLVKGINYLASWIRLLREVRRLQADAVVLYYHLLPWLDGFFVDMLVSRGVYTVVCAHDVLPLGREGERNSAYRKLYGSASALVVFSEYARKSLEDFLGKTNPRISMSYFGISEDRVRNGQYASRKEARVRLGLHERDKIILCFGHIKRNKGLEYLLPAFAGVASREPHARLLVIGKPLKVSTEPIFRHIRELGIEDRVVFRPELIPEDEVESYFSAADVVVLPYTQLYQSAVLSLACSMGKPIVATTVGNIPEVLVDGDSGYLVPPHNAGLLQQALADALSEPAQAQRRGRRGRERARHKYSWDRFCGQLAELLEHARTQDGYAFAKGNQID